MLPPAGQGRYLLGTGPLEEKHPDPGCRGRLANRERTVVAQQHERLVPQIRHQSFAFFMIQRQAFIAMVGDLMLKQAGASTPTRPRSVACAATL